MPAILYRGLDQWRVFDDAEVEAAESDGWYVLTPAGHPLTQPVPEGDAPPAKRPRGRPRKYPVQE